MVELDLEARERSCALCKEDIPEQRLHVEDTPRIHTIDLPCLAAGTYLHCLGARAQRQDGGAVLLALWCRTALVPEASPCACSSDGSI